MQRICAATWIIYVQLLNVLGRNLPRSSDVQTDHWHADIVTGDHDNFKCYGIPCDQYEIIQKIVMEHELSHDSQDDLHFDSLPGNGERPLKQPLENILDGCVLYTLDDIQDMFSIDSERKKRGLKNFIKDPQNKWDSLPIHYKFDGSHDKSKMELIRNTFKDWEKDTCIRFKEIPEHSSITEHYIRVSSNVVNGCKAHLGKTSFNPQLLNLGPGCFEGKGDIIHEIGHVLGLYHTQQRIDRDEYIQVIEKNIGFYNSQFWKANTIAYGLPYDYQSIMHYDQFIGSKNSNPTVVTKDSLFQNTLGQRTGISYLDAKLVNFAYCNDTCQHALRFRCRNGGYQDPNNCDRCKCPDGLSGDDCKLPAAPVKAKCGGTIYLRNDDTSFYIESPGRENPGYYENGVQCSWIVKVPEGSHVALEFVENFSVYFHNFVVCHHWVEVKYAKDLSLPGPRFCGYSRPENRLISDDNEMVVVFKSNYETQWVNTRRGFKAKLSTVQTTGSVTKQPYMLATERTATQTSITASSTRTSTQFSTSTSTPKSTQPSTSTSTLTSKSTQASSSTPSLFEAPTQSFTSMLRLTPSQTSPSSTPTSSPGVKIEWGPWSTCSGHCKCGGCSTKTRQLLCNSQKCTGQLEKTETLPCDRKCTDQDFVYRWIGALYKEPCATCCHGFKEVNDTCVPS